MTRFSLALVGASALLLQACVFAPGMHMDSNRLISDDAAENSMVEMVQITPKLIAQDQTGTRRMTIPQELLDYQPENYRIGPNDAIIPSSPCEGTLAEAGGRVTWSRICIRTGNSRSCRTHRRLTCAPPH